MAGRNEDRNTLLIIFTQT